jgi:hypothetical protein
MSGEVTTFSALPVGALFTYNGNRCCKLSTKTAEMIEYRRWFYFRQNDVVTLGYAGIE